MTLARSGFWNVAAATFLIWTVGVLLVPLFAGGDARTSSNFTFLLSLATGIAAALLARGWLDGMAIAPGFFLSVVVLSVEGSYQLAHVDAATLVVAWLILNLSSMFFFCVTYWVRRAVGRRIST
jgi:hypothetical protein